MAEDRSASAPHSSSRQAQAPKAHLSLADQQARFDANARLLALTRETQEDAQPFLDELAVQTATLCRAQACVILRFDNGMAQYCASHGIAPDVLEGYRQSFPAPLPDQIAQMLVENGANVLVRNQK